MWSTGFLKFLIDLGQNLAGDNGVVPNIPVLPDKPRHDPFRIRDRIRPYGSANPIRQRSIHEINFPLFHRLDLSKEGVDPTADQVAEWFEHHPKYKHMPYGLIVWDDGRIDQTLHLSDVGPHALQQNRKTYGIAIYGRLDRHPASPAQESAAVFLGRHLYQMFQDSVGVYGHMELGNSSSDKNKKCPGPYFPMETVRMNILKQIRQESRQRLADCGFVLGPRGGAA